MKYLAKIRQAFAREPAFTMGDLRRLLPEASPAYLYLLVHHLKAKHALFKLGRGVYSFSDDPMVVGFAFRPFYYGCQEALSVHGLWEQETVPVVVTTRTVRAGRRSFSGAGYVVRRISRQMFFGFQTHKYGKFWVPVSDVEKTLIDLVHMRQPLSEELMGEFRQRVDRDKLEKCLERCPKALAGRIAKMMEEDEED